MGPIPKAGLHMHWLLAHCAVFKERDALVPSSYRLRSFSTLRWVAVGFRCRTRGLTTLSLSLSRLRPRAAGLIRCPMRRTEIYVQLVAGVNLAG